MASKSQSGATGDAEKGTEKSAGKPAAAENAERETGMGAGLEPARPASFGVPNTGVPSAEERAAAAREREERQNAASLGLGAHAVDEEGARALAVPTNTALAQTITGPGDMAAGPVTQESAVVPREADAGFVRNGVEVTALGTTAKMLPLQHEAPPVAEFPTAVTNQPFGSEAGFVDPQTGERRFQPKTKEHLLGAGQPAGASDEKQLAPDTDKT